MLWFVLGGFGWCVSQGQARFFSPHLLNSLLVTCAFRHTQRPHPCKKKSDEYTWKKFHATHKLFNIHTAREPSPRVRTPCGHGAQVIVEGREEQTDGGEKNKDPKTNPKPYTQARRPKLHHLVVFPLHWVKHVKRKLVAINGPEFSKEKDGSASCVHGKPPRRLQTDFPSRILVTSGHTTVWQNKVTLQVRCLAMLQRWL